jgi:hypothetical protein
MDLQLCGGVGETEEGGFMSIFDGIFGTMGGMAGSFSQQQRQRHENEWQMWNSQRTEGYLVYNPAQAISMQYFDGMANNRQVTCAYCRTGRESRHKTCKGCGASEVMG